jgi:hypothetical protein
VKQESLIHLFHILRIQVGLPAQYGSNEAAIGVDKLLQRAGISRKQPRNKPHFVIEVHHRLHAAME